MYPLYTILGYILLPFVLLRLWLKSRHNPDFTQRWTEWVGLGHKTTLPNTVWIHAVSVGETRIAIPCVQALQQRYPHLNILLTNNTSTAADQIRAAKLSNRVRQSYAPLDVPFAVKRFLDVVQPCALILVETELWPHYLRLCRHRQIPIILLNARLSERSAQRYRHFSFGLIHTMINQLNNVLAQTQPDADRFLALGLSKEQLHVTGNIKYDLNIPESLPAEAKQLRAQWTTHKKTVWIAASTHPGEETTLLQAYAQIRREVPDSLFVWVPRHLDHIAAMKAQCLKQGYQVLCRSESKSMSTIEADILLGDTMGELLLFYAAADLAFVGGSLIPKGGQNPIEPAILGRPVLFGPHTFNFTQITDQLLESGGATRVNTADQLAEQVISLLQNPETREQQGQAAQRCIAQNRGALQKQLNYLETWLEPVFTTPLNP